MDKLKEAQEKGDVSSIISLQQAIKFNGGGHINHTIFWDNLAPPSEGTEYFFLYVQEFIIKSRIIFTLL